MSQQPSAALPKKGSGGPGGVAGQSGVVGPGGVGGPGVSPMHDQPPEESFEEVGAGMPAWLDAAFPWAVSLTFHLGLFLVFTFAIYLYQHKQDEEKEQIIIPSSFTDPAANDKEGGIPHPGAGGDPNRDAAQDLVKITKTDGWAQSESKDNVAGLLDGQTAENDAMMIALGTGGSVGRGQGGSGTGSSGVLAPYGTPGGGGGMGPKSNFIGSRGQGKKIVYILDHSGSMLDNFDFLRQEAIRSVNNMIPVQQFSVVMVSETATAIFPTLQRATPEVKKDFGTKLAAFRAQGSNDDLLDPFKDAFEKAFAMKPDLIYFLTDGHFDPRLTVVVDKLNVGKKVHVNTLAFITKEPSYEEQLKDMAKTNVGNYKFVSVNDLGK